MVEMPDNKCLSCEKESYGSIHDVWYCIEHIDEPLAELLAEKFVRDYYSFIQKLLSIIFFVN